MTTDQPGYFINQNLIQEMARLQRQAALVTREMGGVLPELQEGERARLHSALDIACGPGEWTIEVARAFPHMHQVIGVDISRRMISYASAQAEAQGRKVAFQVMDVTRPLTFDDASFDLVNARFLLSFLRREQWPPLLKECVRILKPGGILRITEQESGFSNSPIYQAYIDMWGTAWMRSGHSFAHTKAYVGVTVLLKQMMRRAGLVETRQRPISIDLSTGEAAHEELMGNLIDALQLASEFLIRAGAAATQEEINTLHKQMESLVGAEDFCAYWLLQTVLGSKPRTESQ